jgi:hypothetical protein
MLEGLNRMERRILSLNKTPQPAIVTVPEVDMPLMSRNSMSIHVLDLTHLLTQGLVFWQPHSKEEMILTDGPEDVILYSLIAGKNEVIMFGGTKPDSSARSNTVTTAVYNDVHIISAKHVVI